MIKLPKANKAKFWPSIKGPGSASGHMLQARANRGRARSLTTLFSTRPARPRPHSASKLANNIWLLKKHTNIHLTFRFLSFNTICSAKQKFVLELRSGLGNTSLLLSDIVHRRELIISQLVNLVGNDLKLTRFAFEIAAILREQKSVPEPVRHTVEV